MSSLAPKFCGFWHRFFSLELDRVGAVGGELDGEVVDLLRDAGRVRVRAKLRRVGACALEAEHDVVGSEGRAVVELDARAQLEAPRGRIHLRPRFGESGHLLQLLVAHDEELVDLRVDVVGQVLVLRMRIGGLHVAAARPAQRDRVGARRRDGKDDRERDGGESGETHLGILQ
jgi:hypothetical protein